MELGSEARRTESEEVIRTMYVVEQGRLGRDDRGVKRVLGNGAAANGRFHVWTAHDRSKKRDKIIMCLDILGNYVATLRTRIGRRRASEIG